MLGAVVAFLFFNWEPSEIFMGDTGALVIGMMISIFAIHFIELNNALPITHPYKINAGVSGAICIILIPLADTLRVFILRVAKKQSPFTPDKNHIHHYIMRLGLSHSKSSIFLGAVQVIFIAVFLLLRNVNDNYLLLGIFTFCTVMSIVLDRVIKGKLVKDSS
jgi:UDP-N-acetylmuramyl pentapeptide phosphotransferase/UDP-N-acetylglucosamine-1-phosphate transferase